MKNSINKLFICLILISTIAFTNCENSKEETLAELTIEEKVTLLESSEWLLKGFESAIKYSFSEGTRSTYYGIDGVFGQAIPGTNEYSISEDSFVLDLNFGHIKTYQITVSCDNNIVEFFEDGELNNTLYKKDSNYQDCL